MDKCREAFEQYIRSKSGFTSDFQIGCNGQYKSDLMHFMFITWQEQQKRIDELQARVDAQKKHIEMALIAVKDIHKSALDEFHEWDVLKEQTPKLCEHLQNLSVAVGELEQAIKGGEV